MLRRSGLDFLLRDMKTFGFEAFHYPLDVAHFLIEVSEQPVDSSNLFGFHLHSSSIQIELVERTSENRILSFELVNAVSAKQMLAGLKVHWFSDSFLANVALKQRAHVLN